MPFNFDMSEIVVLVVFAVILFGPEKLPDLARKAGRLVNYLRDIANDARGQLAAELGPEFEQLSVADLNPRALVNKHLLAPAQAAIEPVKAELAPVGQTFAGATAAVGASAPRPSPTRASEPVRFDTEAT